MKVIFSRKGFDSSFGGCPSPIIEGRPYSFPIPTHRRSSTRYKDIGLEHCQRISEITKGRITGDNLCHLDPDIDFAALDRVVGWKGALGQAGIAASHLRKEGVGSGDIFLFFGLFRKLVLEPKVQFIGVAEHRIFGWLQVDEVIEVGEDGRHALIKHPWLKDHPHVRADWEGTKLNLLYIAKENLLLPDRCVNLKGYGIFPRGYKLSTHEKRKSLWKVPEWLNPLKGGTGLTYHATSRWQQDNLLQTVGKGQEFVTDISERSDALDWLENLFCGDVNA